ncbi:uncharacterized protein [Porites lutea]|uniref:uncharacterized protein n=1 Tax=Porites lutea TaxID=51062 RepID=UPI003CC5E7D7
MAAKGTQEQDSNPQDLNLIYKSLGELESEGEKWKEYTENVTSFILENLSKILGKTTENRVMFRPYGSAAEDLKCQDPNDVGDVDIVIFPTADNLAIDEELIEYLPDNVMHVRIKGAGHPVLQSCLVEDTEYVATSALKNFHPAIYGSASPHIVDFVSNMIQVMSRKEFIPALQFTCELKNKTTSPAVTLNFAQSFGSVLEELEQMKDDKNRPTLDASVLEFFAQWFCDKRGVEYTREHVEAVNDLLKLVKDLNVSVRERGLSGDPKFFRTMIQEIVSSDRTWEIRARIRDAESRSGSETERKKDLSAEATLDDVTHQNVTAKHFQESERRSGEENVSQVKFPSSERPDNKETNETTEENALAQNESTERGLSEWSVHPDQSAEKLERNTLTQREIYNRWFKHVFSQVTEKEEEACFTEKAQRYQRIGGFDFVPAFRCNGWPKVAREWIKRERKWPSPDVVHKILQEGYHLVVKPPKNGNRECDFRISFAHAEYLLSQELNSIQRECYRCLKRHYRALLSTQPKSLVTFHLKNLFLQTIEETGTEMWTEANRAKCMLKLFENLLQAMTKKVLPHFFVRFYNLFCGDYIERPEVLDSLAQKVEQIMKSPIQSAKALIQEQNSKTAGQVQEEESIPRNDLARRPINQDHNAREDALSTPSYDKEKWYRYHDLKDNFLTVCEEVIDKVFSDDDWQSETLDPLEKSLVEDLREIASSQGVNAEEYRRMFQRMWDSIYHKVWFDTDPNMRRRMLRGMQGLVEMWKYILKQPDCKPGNEEIIARRLLDPSVEDPFDLSHVIPADSGIQLARRIFECLKPRHAETQEPDLDGIPLD